AAGLIGLASSRANAAESRETLTGKITELGRKIQITQTRIDSAVARGDTTGVKGAGYNQAKRLVEEMRTERESLVNEVQRVQPSPASADTLQGNSSPGSSSSRARGTRKFTIDGYFGKGGSAGARVGTGLFGPVSVWGSVGKSGNRVASEVNVPLLSGGYAGGTRTEVGDISYGGGLEVDLNPTGRVGLFLGAGLMKNGYKNETVEGIYSENGTATKGGNPVSGESGSSSAVSFYGGGKINFSPKVSARLLIGKNGRDGFVGAGLQFTHKKEK
ncbi:MAG: hypothetical protein KJ905_03820, partial [Nanoarchaeota archaeon]|nr:hypothetical protein [Nanoarchaeota archaeon]MBU1501869.1 hypothetical protein [Nanoarchaeota archaeon]MBU2458757.1 hypothetical protein [Nanoarchaeota archaeon]